MRRPSEFQPLSCNLYPSQPIREQSPVRSRIWDLAIQSRPAGICPRKSEYIPAKPFTFLAIPVNYPVN